MTRPERRWQLLLVADNGRIIPFRHIKGFAMVLVVLLAMLCLVCVGLAWQLTAQRIRSQRLADQLSDARETAQRHQRQLELVSAELVLAEARMEKAGLPIPRREIPVAAEAPSEQPDVPAAQTLPTDAAVPQKEDAAVATEPMVAAAPSSAPQPSPAMTPAGPAAVEPEGRVDLTVRPAPEALPALVLENPEVVYDADRRQLTARTRLKNASDRSDPLEGRCVWVLQDGLATPDGWISMPPVPLAGGRPDGGSGQDFRISRFIDMEIQVAAPANPSTYRSATIYIFDKAGALLAERTIALDLPPSREATVASDAPAVQAMTAPAPATVAVDELSVVVSQDSRSVLARLRIKKTGSHAGPVEGRCLVVLKGGLTDPSRWLALPAVPLQNGRPSGRDGRTFRISRFIDLELKIPAPTVPERFSMARLYVFDSGGGILLESDFPVDLTVQPPPAPVTPAIRPAPGIDTGQAPAAAPADTPAPTQPIESTPASDGTATKRMDAWERF